MGVFGRAEDANVQEPMTWTDGAQPEYFPGECSLMLLLEGDAVSLGLLQLASNLDLDALIPMHTALRGAEFDIEISALCRRLYQRVNALLHGRAILFAQERRHGHSFFRAYAEVAFYRRREPVDVDVDVTPTLSWFS
ncbi:hypothetical protein LZ554_004347 [Drepanopeziza brunnea f. sp. 'monogermtubi']|nr:hypothetical protein LZ554_004347 [Drepanopeziza brunnea f. sp. 'monogermtubi']